MNGQRVLDLAASVGHASDFTAVIETAMFADLQAKASAEPIEARLATHKVLRVLSDEEDAEAELLKELEDITVDTDDEGLFVKADTLGSLEAVVHLLKEMDIPIRSAEIGDVSKRDVIDASIAKDENIEHGVIIAFNVKVHPKAENDLSNSGVKLFAGDVIYQITEDYEAWVQERKEAQKKQWLESIIKPAKLMILPKLIFRQSKPAICGIEVEAGTVKQGYSLMNANGDYVGTIASMEDKGETLTAISRGQRVASIFLP